MRDKRVTFTVQAALIAALYVVLTFVASQLGLASHTIQLRLSEVLCILPFFTPAAVPGLWIGCLAANLLTGAIVWDVVFGGLATLIGAAGTYLLRRHRFWCTLPPVIANSLIVPLVLIYGYGIPRIYLGETDLTYLFNVFTVGIGEAICVCVLGSMFLRILSRYQSVIFGADAGQRTKKPAE